MMLYYEKRNESFYLFNIDDKVFGRTLTNSNKKKKSYDLDLHFGMKGQYKHKLIETSLSQDSIKSYILRPLYTSNQISEITKDYKIEVEFTIGNNKEIGNNGHVQFRVNKLYDAYEKFGNSQKDTIILDIKNKTFYFLDIKKDLIEHKSNFIEYIYSEKYEKDIDEGLFKFDDLDEGTKFERKCVETNREIKYSLRNKDYDNEEKNAYIKSIVKRRNPQLQSKFREDLLDEFGSKCAVCDIKDKNLLIASHIIDLCLCKNEKDEYDTEKMFDPNNGLLLCACHDALFDKKLISFEHSNGKVLKREKVSKRTLDLCNINKNTVLKERYLTKRSKYLEEREERFFKNSKILK